MGRLKFTDEEFLAIYYNGKNLNDRQIAKELTVSANTICKRRNKLGLPSRMRESQLRFSDEAFFELYNKGLTDNELSVKLNVSKSTILKRRRRFGLSFHRKFHGKFTDEEFLELYNKDFDDDEIAKKLNVCFGTVGMRRRKLGLVPVTLKSFYKTKKHRYKGKGS